ncbi:hypothetical protein TIFTF001_028458 [Ficus carica]|uniref:SWIM-type domain-containing protein n=1 Tax=Ficus carica TaxID=3494 RepID=A0AA88DPU1_FICCA|nr:hypothetical protein TIFTF001_028458 [Ficus carica]
MAAVCVFIKYNGQWDGILRYIDGEMKGILMSLIITYVGLIELVRSVIGIRGLEKTTVTRYTVEPRMPLVRIQCDADVNFYIQLKKNDVFVFNKFPISINVLDESVAEAIPPEVGESNHIHVQPSRDGGQSLNLHMEDGLEEQHELLNNDLGMNHDDCNVWELNVANATRNSNERSIAGSIGTQFVVNRIRTQSIHVPGSDNFSGAVVVADFTPITMRINNNFDNKKLLQYHLHHDTMSKHYQFKVKRSTTTLLHVVCIDNETCPWQLRATKMKGSELFVVKRYDDVHTCSIEIVQGHHRQAKSWMIGECVKFCPPKVKWLREKNHSSDIHIETDSEKSLKYFYMCLAALKQGWPHCRPVIVVDGSALKARFGGMMLVTCGHDTYSSIFPLAFGIVSSETNESWKWFFEKLQDSIGTRESLAIVADTHNGIEYAANIVYPDANFGICVQHLTANLKMRYKDFEGPTKTYFDGASGAYLVSEHQHHMESIRSCNPDMHRYLLQADPKKWSRAYFNGQRELLQRWFIERRREVLKLTSKLAPKAEKLIRTQFSLGLTVTPRLANQFEYAVTNKAAQTWIVDMRERTCTCKPFQFDQIPCPHAMTSNPKLSILPRQSVVPEGQVLLGFCPKVRNQRLFGATDVMVMDTTGKFVLNQYHHAHVQQQGCRDL